MTVCAKRYRCIEAVDSTPFHQHLDHPPAKYGITSNSLFEHPGDDLSRQQIYDRRDASIHEAFEESGTTLVEALPAMGKSYGVVKWADSTGHPLTIFTSRRELYGQYEEWCVDQNLTHLALPAFHHDCETMEGENPIEAKVNEIYQAGITGAEIHQKSERYFGHQLPCQKEGRCSYMERREFEPGDYDVLIGHYLQAHNENYIQDRYVAFDEFPGDSYFFEPTHNEATKAITNYLQAEDTLPFDNWKELTRYRHKIEFQDSVIEWTEDMGFYSHRDTRLQLQRSPGFHAHAPLLTHAGLEFELLDNQWEYAELGSGRVAVRSPEDEWTVLIPPSLYAAESVVALDGTPTITKWRLVLGGDYITHEEVLDSDIEKQEYLRDVLGLQVIQTNAGTKPYQSGTYVNIDSDGALLEGIYEREGRRPAVITSKQAKDQYASAGMDQLIESSEHYGNLKGSNKFETTRLGAVIGSPHPPEDEAVKRWGVLDGEPVERSEDEDGRTKRGKDLDFGALGNALFRDNVEKEVLQAVMRFGRTKDEDGQGATVYVHTSRLPLWVNPVSQVNVGTWSDGMKEVVDALSESDEWPEGELTNREIAANTEIGKRQVSELMKELEVAGYVSSRRGGRGNAYHWSNERIDDFTEFGRLE